MARSLKYPALALAFAFELVCYSVWDLSGQRYSLGGAPSAGATPTGDTTPTVACRIALGVAMAVMLQIMS
jgi:hypothetical protein